MTSMTDIEMERRSVARIFKCESLEIYQKIIRRIRRGGNEGTADEMGSIQAGVDRL